MTPVPIRFIITAALMAATLAACGGRSLETPAPAAPAAPATAPTVPVAPTTTTASEPRAVVPATATNPAVAPATPEARYEAARAAAIAYVRALAAGVPPDSADTAALAAWLRRLPLGELRVETAPDYLLDADDRAGVVVTVSTRFGTEPASAWIVLGERTLEVVFRDGSWEVSADRTSREGALDRRGRPCDATGRARAA